MLAFDSREILKQVHVRNHLPEAKKSAKHQRILFEVRVSSMNSGCIHYCFATDLTTYLHILYCDLKENK